MTNAVHGRRNTRFHQVLLLQMAFHSPFQTFPCFLSRHEPRLNEGISPKIPLLMSYLLRDYLTCLKVKSWVSLIFQIFGSL